MSTGHLVLRVTIRRPKGGHVVRLLLRRLLPLLAFLLSGNAGARSADNADAGRRTSVSIRGEAFLVNGHPANEGRTYNGVKIEGLLFNARMVNGIFDDRNPETRDLWKYPDGPWDPDRNTRGFVEAMPGWKKAGLLSFTLNLQGGSPYGYGNPHPSWNSAFDPDGSLDAGYLSRLQRILDRADELGMAPILGFFYGAQEQRLDGEAAVCRAVDGITDWLLSKGYTNVLIEIANECNVSSFKHDIVRPARAHELILRVRQRSHGRLLVATSFTGGVLPSPNVIEAEDFILLHGNGLKEPAKVHELVKRVRADARYHGQPILFNEDDHYGFDRDDNDFLAAVTERAGWGFFDYREKGEGFDEGFQSVPCNWSPTSSARKRGFFQLLAKMTGGQAG